MSQTNPASQQQLPCLAGEARRDSALRGADFPQLSRATFWAALLTVLFSSTAVAQLADLVVDKGKIILSKTRADADKIVIKASADVAGIPPSLEQLELGVTIGSFSDTVPTGGLIRRDSPRGTFWKYRGDKGRLKLLKVRRRNFEYEFKIIAKNLDLPPPPSLVPITIQIGGDTLTWQGYFEINELNTKSLYKYPGSRRGDADGDGFARRDDCDDQDPSAAPGFAEVCDGVDNDCDGAVDEDIPSAVSGSDTGLCRREIVGCLAGETRTIQEGVGPVAEVCDDGLDQDCNGSDCTWLQVRIDEPSPGAVTGVASIDVTGTVSSSATSVTVNEVAASLSAGSFVATGVALEEGTNLLTATAVDDAGRVATGSVSVTLDLRPPTVVITNPPDGAVLTATSVVVVGLVNDIVVGTVNAEQAQVECNGLSASVANRTFSVVLPLVVGANTIACSAVDQAGNSSSTSVDVVVDPSIRERITIVSGEFQAGTIGTQLGEPIVVRVEDDDGDPLPGQTVIFRVVQNDGVVSSGTETARSVAVTTDPAGEASVDWTLGSRAGAGLNRARAFAPGIEGEVFFCASAGPGPPGLIVVDAGDHQRTLVGERLPEPLVAVVVDSGSNRLADVPVTFTITEGNGSFDGEPTASVITDSDGRARVFFTLGPDAGIENNVVEATFPGNQGFAASFSASGYLPGDPRDTRISGVVLDNSGQPVPGVTIRLENRFVVTTTDGAGKFSFSGVLPGRVVMIVDGITATRPGVWPDLRFELEVVPGRDNSVQRGPIYLLPINVDEGVFVDETSGGTLTLAQVPGFALEIEPGSATFPDGSTSGIVSATLVHSDKVPMTPAFGQQPRFVITIQPAGTAFDPPAKLTLPNTDGLPPGQITEMYSFDHDLNQFVAIGTGSVSSDGSVIVADPGVGVVKAGWHCGGNPNRTGSAANCPQCQRCLVNICVPLLEGACDDGDGCTVGDSCAAGVCTAGQPRDCDDTNACTLDTCSEGGCVHINPSAGLGTQCDGCVDGTPCSDGNECTMNDRCVGGGCIGEPRDCDDGNECSADSCDPQTGCQSIPDSVDCDDENSCTDDACFPGEGCVHQNTRAGAADQCEGCSDGTPCSDNDECTVGDACQDGGCVSGSPRDCDDQNQCTNDSCDSVIGCQNVNSREGQPEQCEGCADETPCSDNNICTEGDTCGSEQCVAGNPRDCNDMEDCTVDRCDSESGCVNDSREGACEDDNECTPTGSCADGMCIVEENLCGNGAFDASCGEECDGEASPDCPGRCSNECRCCDVEVAITSPTGVAATCVGEMLTVDGTVSENVGVTVNGVSATIVGDNGMGFDWTAEVPVGDQPGPILIEAVAAAPDCEPKTSTEAIALGVGTIEVRGGEVVDDGDGDPNTSAALVAVAGDSGFIEFSTIAVTTEPPIDDAALPECWNLFVTGRPPAKQLSASVGRFPARQVTAVATAGSSSKELEVFFVDAMLDKAAGQKFGYSRPVVLSDGLVSNPIAAKSVKVGDSDAMEISVTPSSPLSKVVASTRATGVATVPMAEFSGAPSQPQTLTVSGLSRGKTLLELSLGSASGPHFTDELHEIRAYGERRLEVAVRVIIESNDDVQLVPVGQPSAFACVGAGGNGFLETEAAGDDIDGLPPGHIGPGFDGVCDTLANNLNQVPVDVLASEIALESYLNDVVFNQAVVSWDATRVVPALVNYDLNRDGKLLSHCNEAGSPEAVAIFNAADPIGFDKVVFIVNEAGGECGCCENPGRYCFVMANCLLLSSNNCSSLWVTAHELGHSVGLPHTPLDKDNILYPTCSGAIGTALRGNQWDIVNP